ncbi:MAG: tetratricopeptide repeat protein, partial [Pseudomonadota bacterium]
NVSARTTLVGLYAQTGQDELAESQFEQARTLDPARPKLFYNLSLLRWRQGRQAEASAALREATRLDPDDPASWTQLGLVKESLLDTMAAEDAYRRALSVSPTHSDANFLLGRSLLNRNAAEEAIAFLESSLGGPPAKTVPRVRLLARAHVNAGHVDKAIAVIDDSLAALDPVKDAQFRTVLRRDRRALLESQGDTDSPDSPTDSPTPPTRRKTAANGVAS